MEEVANVKKGFILIECSQFQTVRPHFALLADNSTKDRPAKRRAIEAIRKSFTCIKEPVLANESIEQFTPSLLNSTESQIETVREQSVQILKSLVKANGKNAIQTATIDSLLTALLSRIDTKNELTEEVRAIWLELAVELLGSRSAATDLWLDIIELALKDPFPEAQKLAAKVILSFVENYPKEVDYSCDRMVRLVFPLLTHKHIATRVLGIKSIESVLLTSAKGINLLFEHSETQPPIIPALVYDTSALVRQQLFVALGHLICRWSPSDRYQYSDRILPIVLCGVFDELPDVQTTCNLTLTEVAGSCTQDLYESQILERIPEELEKKELGLKHLVHMCFEGSLSDILEKSMDFVESKKETSLSALKMFLSYSTTDDIVSSIQRIINCLVLVYSGSQKNCQLIILEVILLLFNTLLIPDIILDVLLSKLAPKYLSNESSGLSTEATLKVVIQFLFQISSTKEISLNSSLRIKSALKKYHIEKYNLDSDTRRYFNILTLE